MAKAVFLTEMDAVLASSDAKERVSSRPITKSAGLWVASETVDWAFFWSFVAGLAWVPLWYGSNDVIAWGINALLFPGMAVAYEIFLLVRDKGHPVAAKEIRISMTLFVAVVVWIVIQNATWTPIWMHHPIWSLTEDALNVPVAGSISVNRDATTLALVRLLTAASVFWTALQLCRNTKRASYFMTAIAIIISGYSVYGLAEFSLLQSRITVGRSYLTSTFVNHNHFAAYAGIGLVVIFGFILRIYEREVAREGGSFRIRIGMFLEHSAQTAALLFAGGFLIFVALLLTGSRGGIVAVGLGVFALVIFILGSPRSLIGARGLFLTLVVAIVSGALMAFGDSLVAQLSDKGVSDQNRLSVYMITLRSILDAPLLGYGYGTFADVFPMFRERSIDVFGIWEQAHNTYLELFQGLGLIFGLALVSSVVLLVAKCIRGATQRQEGVIPLVATSVAVLVGVHAFADFSLQIQALTLTFMAMLGTGVAQSQSSRMTLKD